MYLGLSLRSLYLSCLYSVHQSTTVESVECTMCRLYKVSGDSGDLWMSVQDSGVQISGRPGRRALASTLGRLEAVTGVVPFEKRRSDEKSQRSLLKSRVGLRQDVQKFPKITEAHCKLTQNRIK